MVRLQNSVKNPPSTRPSDTLQIQSELLDLASGNYYLVDQLQGEILVTANKANTFQHVSITRSEDEVSIETDLQICITPTNPVPSNSKLTIVYP